MDLYPRTAWKGGKSPDREDVETQNESMPPVSASGTSEGVGSDEQGMAAGEAGDNTVKDSEVI